MAAKNVEKNPEAAARKFAKAAPQADQDILAQPRYWDVHERTTAEAMGSPDQFAEEARLLARRWKVEPVAMPAAVWVGERDLTHPPVMARRLAERLGGVPVTVVPGAATFGMVPALRNVLDFVA
jgi:pimeloyl-ACP methyl ester carboxylesterase